MDKQVNKQMFLGVEGSLPPFLHTVLRIPVSYSECSIVVLSL